MSEKELIQQRLDKIEKIRAAGIEPYAFNYTRSHTAGELQETFAKLQGEEQSEAEVSIAGRIVAYRAHGKTIFCHLQDSAGQIQLYFGAKELPEEKWDLVKKVDVGDFIGVKGVVFRTRTKELTIKVTAIELLSKAIRTMPEKWHGLKDIETRYRQRYLDIMTNPKSREVFNLRSRIIKEIRNFLDQLGYMEVETPMMQAIPGGAAAKPFKTYHNALDRDLYLRIAPELYLKRLLVGGWEKVYEMNRNFRNEGISTMHNPEFTMLEVYQAYADGQAMMDLTEKLVSHLVKTIKGELQIEYQGQKLDFTPPWQRVSYISAIEKELNIEMSKESKESLSSFCQEHKLDAPKNADKYELIEILFEGIIEKKLIQPTFVIDFPTAISPLAKQKIDQPEIADRFEPYLMGREIANGFSELNDPLEQRRRFEGQLAKREKGDEEAQRMDEDFIRALEYGMPPAGGLGIGIDRLVMFLTDAASIRDVILFPQLRNIINPE